MLLRRVRSCLVHSSTFGSKKLLYCNVKFGVATISSTHASKQSNAVSAPTAMSKVRFFAETPLHLLPLLQSSEKCRTAAPIDRLQSAARRLAFTTKDASNEEVEWHSSTHIFPSAYPRSHPKCTAPPSDRLPEVDRERATAVEKSKEREARAIDFAKWDRIADSNRPESFYPPATEEAAICKAEEMAKQGQPQLWNVAQRIVPNRIRKSDNSITLFLAHANGFHKEVSR